MTFSIHFVIKHHRNDRDQTHPILGDQSHLDLDTFLGYKVRELPHFHKLKHKQRDLDQFAQWYIFFCCRFHTTLARYKIRQNAFGIIPLK